MFWFARVQHQVPEAGNAPGAQLLPDECLDEVARMHTGALQHMQRFNYDKPVQAGIARETRKLHLVFHDVVHLARAVASREQSGDKGPCRRSGDMRPAIALLFHDTERANVTDAAHTAAFKHNISLQAGVIHHALLRMCRMLHLCHLFICASRVAICACNAILSARRRMSSWPIHATKMPRAGVHSRAVQLKTCCVPPPSAGFDSSSGSRPSSSSRGILAGCQWLAMIYSRKPRTTLWPLGAVSVAPSSCQPGGTTGTNVSLSGSKPSGGTGSQVGNISVALTNCNFAASYLRGPGRRLFGL